MKECPYLSVDTNNDKIVPNQDNPSFSPKSRASISKTKKIILPQGKLGVELGSDSFQDDIGVGLKIKGWNYSETTVIIIDDLIYISY
jgi:hypothetical protein